MSTPFKSTIGVNFSNTFQSAGKKVDTTTAVEQIAATGAKTVKMFTYNQADCISGFAGKGMEVLVDVPNGDLAACAANDQSTINAIIKVLKDNTETIKYICVGNEPLGSWWKGAYTNDLVPAMRNIKNAIAAADGVNTKVTVPFNYAIMDISYPPSKGSLKSATLQQVKDVCAMIKEDSSVFMINVYPFLTYIGNLNTKYPTPLDYCLFTADNNPGSWVHDGAYTYKNIFDAMYDALKIAMQNNGYGDLQIVIGEAGWPTDPTGTYPSAKSDNAKVFNQHLIDHCKSTTGTPRNPGISIPCFVFEMYDEDTKPTDAGTFEHFWGVYEWKNGSYSAKYNLNW